MNYNNGKELEGHLLETLETGHLKTVKALYRHYSPKSTIGDYILLRMILRTLGRADVVITRGQIRTALKYSPEFKEDGTRAWVTELWEIYEYHRQN